MIIYKKKINLNLKNVYAKTKIRTLNFSTNEDDYTIEKLRMRTVTDLRDLAKNYKIGLSGARKKEEIVHIIFAHYLQKIKSSEFAITLPQTFDILIDDNENINVSIWFQGNIRALDRCISTKRFKKLLDQYCEIYKKQPHEILANRDKNDHLFLPPVLAVFVASYLSPRLYYQILDLYSYG